MAAINYNAMQELKRRMYAMRNGVVADTLRRNGSPFNIIFGVNLPQLTEIASSTCKNKEFAETVWRNSTTRESMLIAPMLMPVDEFTIEDAYRWINQIPAKEVADVLCLKLLRKEPYALQLAQALLTDDSNPMNYYTGARLMCNIASQHQDLAVNIGKTLVESEKPDIKMMGQILLDYDI